MNKELPIVLHNLAVGYSKRGCTCLKCTNKAMKPNGWCS